MLWPEKKDGSQVEQKERFFLQHAHVRTVAQHTRSFHTHE